MRVLLQALVAVLLLVSILPPLASANTPQFACLTDFRVDGNGAMEISLPWQFNIGDIKSTPFHPFAALFSGPSTVVSVVDPEHGYLDGFATGDAGNHLEPGDYRIYVASLDAAPFTLSVRLCFDDSYAQFDMPTGDIRAVGLQEQLPVNPVGGIARVTDELTMPGVVMVSGLVMGQMDGAVVSTSSVGITNEQLQAQCDVRFPAFWYVGPGWRMGLWDVGIFSAPAGAYRAGFDYQWTGTQGIREHGGVALYAPLLAGDPLAHKEPSARIVIPDPYRAPPPVCEVAQAG
jgi:hypothetical protein